MYTQGTSASYCFYCCSVGWLVVCLLACFVFIILFGVCRKFDSGELSGGSLINVVTTLDLSLVFVSRCPLSVLFQSAKGRHHEAIPGFGPFRNTLRGATAFVVVVKQQTGQCRLITGH